MTAASTSTVTETPAPQVWPTLKARDARALIDFYVAAFGFDGGHRPVRPGTFGAYVVCDDPDAVFARAVAAGATALREPFDQDHGSRDCALVDPEGNHWQFGTYRGHPVARPGVE